MNLTRSHHLSALVFGVMFLALLSFRGELIALAVPLLVYLILGLARQPSSLELVVQRELSTDRAEEGDLVHVHLSIINRGSHIDEVHLTEMVPRRLHLVSGIANRSLSLEQGAKVEMEYSIRCTRGLHIIKGIRVMASDTFGTTVECRVIGPQSSLLVLPRVRRLRRLALSPRRTRVFSGVYPARAGGSGIEFFGVRRYHEGDPLHRINWRASARHPTDIYVSQFEQERVVDIGLILDARFRSNAIHGRESLFRYSVEAAASLADGFLHQGNRVGLLIYGTHLDWTFPGYGRMQKDRILRALSVAEVGESRIFDQLRNLPTRYFPARSQLVLLSPLVEDDISFLIRLRGAGYQLLVISPDAIPLERRTLPSGQDLALATRIALLERDLVLRRLRQAGIHVVTWNVELPLEEVVGAALSRPPAWYQAIGRLG